MKRYREANKNDYLDAEAIAEAVTRKNLRFVPIKTQDQVDVQGLHRVRERLVHSRTEVINQIRGFPLERGVTFNRGPLSLRKGMPDLLEDAEQNLTPQLRSMLAHLSKLFDEEPDRLNEVVREIARRSLSNYEEKGLQTLFVALGIATWPADDGGRVPESPILLLPVSLNPQGRGSSSFSLASQ